MTSSEALAWSRAQLADLPDVVRRAEFGNESYFVGGSRFAALTDRAAVLHLPPAELLDALRRGLARPFVSAGAMGKNGWVEVALEGVDAAVLERCLMAAYGSAHQSHRRTIPKRPGAARRTRPARNPSR